MNSARSNNRCSLLPSLCLALGLNLCLAGSVAATEIPLRAFSASYDLYRSGLHFATAELSLAPVGNRWRWRLTTEARGIYAMLYPAKPYTETTFGFDEGMLRLQSVVLSDANDEDTEDYESARFDWGKGTLKTLRKGKREKRTLTAEVYDYQSIHLLAARMQSRQLQQATVSFYRKARLAESTLVYQGETTVEIDGSDTPARLYQQGIEGSSTVTRYYYDTRHPWLPLRVETQKRDDSPTILRLRRVEWGSKAG